MFSIAKLFTAALAVTSVAVAAVTPQQAVDGLRLLIQKAQDLQAPAQSISPINAHLVVIGQGPFPVIITGIADQTKTAHALNFAEITPAGDELVFNAYREFVRVEQTTLNILIGKAGLVEQIPLVGQPVAAILRQFEGAIDALSLQLIETVDSRSTDLMRESNSLGETLSLAIEKYEGLSI